MYACVLPSLDIQPPAKPSRFPFALARTKEDGLALATLPAAAGVHVLAAVNGVIGYLCPACLPLRILPLDLQPTAQPCPLCNLRYLSSSTFWSLPLAQQLGCIRAEL